MRIARPAPMRPAACASPSPLDTANRRVDDGNAPLLALRASDRKCDDHHQEIALKKSFDQLELPNSAWFESGFIGQTSPFLPRRPRRLSELYFNPFADYPPARRADNRRTALGARRESVSLLRKSHLPAGVDRSNDSKKIAA